MPLNGECSGSGCFSLQCSPGAYIAIKRTKLCLKMIKNHVTKLVRACIFLCRGSLSLNVLTFTCESFSGVPDDEIPRQYSLDAALCHRIGGLWQHQLRLVVALFAFGGVVVACALLVYAPSQAHGALLARSTVL